MHETLRSAVGEDGIQVAVDALKEIAKHDHYDAKERVTAAQTLLSYASLHTDSLGNMVRA